MRKIASALIVFLTLGTLAAQTVTLTFTAKDAANHYVQLNRVTITNLTKSWQETIYWPDTVLTMQNGTGIDDHTLDGGFALSQNNPNPFSGTTEVSLTTVDEGKVDLDIKDMNGRIIETQNLVSLQPGNHQFRISLSTAGTYVMTARQSGNTSSIKMICNGGGGSNTLDYLGMVQTITVVLKSSTNKPFNFGDMMEYVGYATINGAQAESQRITQTQGSSQTFTLQFSETQIQYQLPSVSTSLVSDISYTSASCGGTVYDDGGASVTARGVCWGTSQNPTVNGSHTTNGNGTGNFTSNITGLTGGTIYYVRAYATNSVGTAYGLQINFTTPADLPTVTTTAVSDVTTTTATCGGNVTSNGGVPVTVRGVCWSSTPNPTVNDSHTTDGDGTGSFSSSITGLASNVTYYVRAYATNNVGTAYGEQCTFTTSAATPTVTTADVSNITTEAAVCGGNVTATGGASVIARGVCWSTTQNPTLNDSHTTDGSGTGSFSSSIIGLAPATTYYVRAYATNSAGIGYGEQKSFTTTGSFLCGSSAITDYDGNSYNTVLLGFQCWMAENLRTSHYSDGSSIAEGDTNNPNCSADDAYYFHPGNSSAFGYLYNWKATMRNAPSSQLKPSGVQGVCPTGWHVPSDAEWTQLQSYVKSIPAYSCDNDSNSIAKALADSTGWHEYSNLTNNCSLCKMNENNNATGFGILPAGTVAYSSYNHYYYYVNFGENTCFWSSTENTGNTVWTRSLDCGSYNLYRYSYSMVDGYSVRCIRDDGTPAYTTAIDGQPCSGVLSLKDYDNNIYNTVHIGTQCWMAQDLCTTHFSDGPPIAEGNENNFYNSEALYFYSPFFGSGRRYNWAAVVHGTSSSNANPSGVQGICPTGWHVPSDAEWSQLTNYVSSMPGYRCDNNSNNIAKALSSTSGWSSESSIDCSISNVSSANNATGFSARAGQIYIPNTPLNPSGNAYFWSSTENSNAHAWYRSLQYNQSNITRNTSYKSSGCMVRCILNETQSCGRPNISTNTVYYITPPSAICGGYVLADGGANVTARGVCWSTSPDPTINDSHTIDGIGTGSFTSNITGLTANETYYVRAYATNSAGTSYGDLRSFIAIYTTPSITTVGVSNIQTTSANCGGNVTATGGSDVTARGICWSTSQNPTVSDSHTTDGTGAGSFTSSITGLTAGTTYHVRAYATNGVGTAYGEQRSFTTLSVPFFCGTSTVTDIDGNTYNSVQIGNQCWMKENLRTTSYANGTSISLGDSQSSTTAYRYYPNNNSSNVATYGYLYNWIAVMGNSSSSSSIPSGVQGICPTGWHVPSDAEWTLLRNYVSSQSLYVCGTNVNNIAKALASATGWNSSPLACAVGNNPSANNSTGFSALPASNYTGNYYFFGSQALFWSATEDNDPVIDARCSYLDSDYADMRVGSAGKNRGHSVRCLKD